MAKVGAGTEISSARQASLLPVRPQLLDDLAALEVDGMTPLEALTKLYELREAARSTDRETD